MQKRMERLVLLSREREPVCQSGDVGQRQLRPLVRESIQHVERWVHRRDASTVGIRRDHGGIPSGAAFWRPFGIIAFALLDSQLAEVGRSDDKTLFHTMNPSSSPDHWRTGSPRHPDRCVSKFSWDRRTGDDTHAGAGLAPCHRGDRRRPSLTRAKPAGRPT